MLAKGPRDCLYPYVVPNCITTTQVSPRRPSKHLFFYCLTVDELEEIVEDKVLAARVAGKLERLGVAHGALLLINLCREKKLC